VDEPTNLFDKYGDESYLSQSSDFLLGGVQLVGEGLHLLETA
jgi:hypothetical protein